MSDFNAGFQAPTPAQGVQPPERMAHIKTNPNLLPCTPFGTVFNASSECLQTEMKMRQLLRSREIETKMREILRLRRIKPELIEALFKASIEDLVGILREISQTFSAFTPDVEPRPKTLVQPEHTLEVISNSPSRKRKSCGKRGQRRSSPDTSLQKGEPQTKRVRLSLEAVKQIRHQYPHHAGVLSELINRLKQDVKEARGLQQNVRGWHCRYCDRFCKLNNKRASTYYRHALERCEGEELMDNFGPVLRLIRLLRQERIDSQTNISQNNGGAPPALARGPPKAQNPEPTESQPLECHQTPQDPLQACANEGNSPKIEFDFTTFPAFPPPERLWPEDFLELNSYIVKISASERA
mmetsp:Transcript_8926/g.21960  ORF Transcript_8926/g.21960 Transcript_8926/m.21960 type:complete len:354 (-) Transcript_8926:103-1164(-)